MSNPHREPPTYEPHPTDYILRVEEDGWRSIIPPLSAQEAVRSRPERVPIKLLEPTQSDTAEVERPARTANGTVHVFEPWPGVTVIQALDRRGEKICELTMPSRLVRIADDLEAVRTILQQRAGLSVLSVL